MTTRPIATDAGPEHLAALEALQARLTARGAVEPEPPAPVVRRKAIVGAPGEQTEVEVTMPSAAAVHDTLRAAEQHAALEARPELRRPSPAGKSTAALLRDYHAREADALAVFTATIARLFNCPQLDSDAGRSRLRIAFGEARAMARSFGASGEVAARRAADPTAPKRDASGRFAKAG